MKDKCIIRIITVTLILSLLAAPVIFAENSKKDDGLWTIDGFRLVPIESLSEDESVIEAHLDNSEPVSVKYAMGGLKPDWGAIITHYKDSEDTKFLLRPGDCDCDGEITAADARKCLRRAARLDDDFSYNPYQYFSSFDYNSDKKITADDARQILRTVSKLDTFPEYMTVRGSAGVKFILTGIRTMPGDGKKWIAESFDEGSDITVYPYYPNEDSPDNQPIGYEFEFSAKESGIYVVHYARIDEKTDEVLDFFTVNYRIDFD